MLFRVNEHPVVAALAQRQQAVDHTVPVEHTALVLRKKGLLHHGCNLQPAKILMGQLHHLFDPAVVHLKIDRLFSKICFEFHSGFPPLCNYGK